MKTRSRMAIAATIATTLLLSGCSAQDREPETDTLRIIGPFEVHSMVPATSSAVFNRLHIIETLVASDLEGRITEGLATSWEPSDDQRTWTFALPADVTFHDGAPLTGQAVANALDHAREQAGSPLATAGIARIEPLEDAVRIELEEPLPTLPAILTHYSTAILSPSAYDDSGNVVDVIGTGAYEAESIELPASIHTTRFADWRGERPEIERVEFQTVSRAESRALMAASGQADVIFHLEPSGRQRVEAAEGVDLVSSLQPRTLYMKVNGEHPVLGDVRVRQAISKAIDRRSIADAVLREPELAATQLFPPSLPQWHSDGLDPLEHDPEGAIDLLAEAGWTEDESGTMQRDGQPLEVTLLTYPDRPELPALAAAIQDQLRQIGVQVKVDVTNSSEIPAGHADGTLELGLLARHLALVSDPLVTVADTFGPDGADWGAMNWRNDEVLAAVDALLAGASEDRAEELRATIARIAQEDLPVIPIAWYRMNAAVSDRIEGFVMDPLEHTWRITDAVLDE
ncbi:ABC transporter substrate-binding protein [Lolliginicoccus levis]|uniref:ABC transporter substrate-binding protein n=1 Tax=Lolliginicoccus levis TaxID=2919542 RepID=UPI00241FE3E0|nr:ABC transporter substrate-binding protein [Lolliginicoccus levis]